MSEEKTEKRSRWDYRYNATTHTERDRRERVERQNKSARKVRLACDQFWRDRGLEPPIVSSHVVSGTGNLWLQDMRDSTMDLSAKDMKLL